MREVQGIPWWRPLAAIRARRAARVGLRDASALLDWTLVLLRETEPPGLRAEVLDRAGRQMLSRATLTLQAYGERRGRELATAARALAWLMAALAAAERARAAGRPRELSRWEALEERAGSLLDQLAQPTVVDETTAAELYAVIWARVNPGLVPAWDGLPFLLVRGCGEPPVANGV